MEKGFDIDANYCSSSPETLFGVRFNYACYLHDRHYRNERKHRLTRLEADRLLRKVIRDYYNKANKKFIGFIVSSVYYVFVRTFGWKWWEKNE